MREEWRPMPNAQYMVSNHGRIYSHDQIVRTKAKNGRWSIRRIRGRLLPLNTNRGYSRFNYAGDVVLVHVMVAKAFIENPDGLETVNHIDGDKTNNRADNLEWLSNADNVRHAWETGLVSHHKPVRCIDTGEVFYSLTEAARSRGLVSSNLTGAIKGRQKTFAGHRWEYC